jgi:hypothetical protein
MAQSNDPDATVAKYHENHDDLFLDYRKALDACRAGWRNGFVAGGMKNGMMSNVVGAPNVAIDCDDAVANPFTDPESDALTGTVQIANSSDSQKRDLIIPAKAVKNFTDGAMMMWTEGEYAAIADRRIVLGKYVEADIKNDAQAFLVKNVHYIYEKDSLANTLLVTQPYKRILMQLGNDDAYWSNVSSENEWGGFSIGYTYYNENESYYVAPTETGGVITSPYNTDDLTVTTYNNELQSISNLEDNTNSTFTATNGVADVTLTGNANGIPAIVTQMLGTSVGGVAQTNWIYAPAK